MAAPEAAPDDRHVGAGDQPAPFHVALLELGALVRIADRSRQARNKTPVRDVKVRHKARIRRSRPNNNQGIPRKSVVGSPRREHRSSHFDAPLCANMVWR